MPHRGYYLIGQTINHAVASFVLNLRLRYLALVFYGSVSRAYYFPIRVWGIRFLILSLGFEDLKVLCLGIRVSCLWIRVSGSGFRV